MTKSVRLDDRIARSDIWYYPGELLDADEMRVTLMGTGWGNIIRPNQKGASIFVELGNGESFIFDTGPGCCVNYNVMQVPFSRMDKIFLTHLHTDHCSDLDWIYTFGPSVDRYTPLRLFGPHNFGDTPRYRGRTLPDMFEFTEGLVKSTTWHRLSFEATLDVGRAYDIELHPLNYRAVPPSTGAPGESGDVGDVLETPDMPDMPDMPEEVNVVVPPTPGVAYHDQQNGITISHWPALHIIDGAVSYCLEWNGYKIVWSGDTRPNHYLMTLAENADLLIHETAPSVDRFMQAQQDTKAQATTIINASHTPAMALGKILSVTNPKLAVTCHSPVDPEEWVDYIAGVRKWWTDPDGAYQIGEDLMVFTLSKTPRVEDRRDGADNSISIRKGYVHERPWGTRVASNPHPQSGPSIEAAGLQTDIFQHALSDEAWRSPNIEGLKRELAQAEEWERAHGRRGDDDT